MRFLSLFAGIDCEAERRRRNTPSLESAAMANWMTPNRIDAKGGSRKGQGQEQLCFQVKKTDGQPGPDNPSTDGKSRALLNPRWVAQLQGFPSDWLDGIEWPL